MQDQTASVAEWLAATGAFIPVVVGILAAVFTYWRRPNLTLHEGGDHSRVERSQIDEHLPSVRLLARNGRFHRSSEGTRVLVEHYRLVGEERSKTYLGSITLGWTSALDAVDGSAILFPDGERSIDLGWFRRDSNGDWPFIIAPHLVIFEGRANLRHRDNGYIIRLVIGSKDGRARRYDAHINWNPIPPDATPTTMADIGLRTAVIPAYP